VSFVFVTPTYRGDLERFRFLRESMLAVGVTQPHVAVVQSEDVERFRRAVPADGLTILASRDVLAPRFERLRQLNRVRAIRGVLPARLQLHGWVAQQLVKLSVGDFVDAPIAVPLDSDAFFLRPFADDFFAAPDGTPHLHEFVDPAAGQLTKKYAAAAEAILDLPEGTADRRRTYVSLVVPLSVAVTRDLRAHLDARHGDWATALVRHGATEYTTYGLFARHVQDPMKVVPVDRRVSAAFYGFEPATFAEQLRAAAADPTMHLGMVHSHLEVPGEAFEPTVRDVWRALPDLAPAPWEPPRKERYGRI
jgi:hypothetical protein